MRSIPHSKDVFLTCWVSNRSIKYALMGNIVSSTRSPMRRRQGRISKRSSEESHYKNTFRIYRSSRNRVLNSPPILASSKSPCVADTRVRTRISYGTRLETHANTKLCLWSSNRVLYITTVNGRLRTYFTKSVPATLHQDYGMCRVMPIRPRNMVHGT